MKKKLLLLSSKTGFKRTTVRPEVYILPPALTQLLEKSLSVALSVRMTKWHIMFCNFSVKVQFVRFFLPWTRYDQSQLLGSLYFVCRIRMYNSFFFFFLSFLFYCPPDSALFSFLADLKIKSASIIPSALLFLERLLSRSSGRDLLTLIP